MIGTIMAVYENGVLRPLEPLQLQERQMVRLQVVPGEEMTDMDAIMRYLVAEGVITPPSGETGVRPISEEELEALADRLGRLPGKPLSEIIIEERGEE